jgi:hypothetical protein
MRGDEIRVVDAFCQWLETEGWHVQREVDWVDVAAERHGQRLYAEVKGRTASPGLDVDTAYGQLLRRMKEDAEGAVFAMVVPQAAIPHALRVPPQIRDRLGIEVFSVDDEGRVRRHR